MSPITINAINTSIGLRDRLSTLRAKATTLRTSVTVRVSKWATDIATTRLVCCGGLDCVLFDDDEDEEEKAAKAKANHHTDDDRSDGTVSSGDEDEDEDAEAAADEPRSGRSGVCGSATEEEEEKEATTTHAMVDGRVVIFCGFDDDTEDADEDEEEEEHALETGAVAVAVATTSDALATAIGAAIDTAAELADVAASPALARTTSVHVRGDDVAGHHVASSACDASSEKEVDGDAAAAAVAAMVLATEVVGVLPPAPPSREPTPTPAPAPLSVMERVYILNGADRSGEEALRNYFGMPRAKPFFPKPSYYASVHAPPPPSEEVRALENDPDGWKALQARLRLKTKTRS